MKRYRNVQIDTSGTDDYLYEQSEEDEVELSEMDDAAEVQAEDSSAAETAEPEMSEETLADEAAVDETSSEEVLSMRGKIPFAPNIIGYKIKQFEGAPFRMRTSRNDRLVVPEGSS